MGGDCGSWPDQQHFDNQTVQTPNFNSTTAWTQQYIGSQNQLSSYMYPWHAIDQDITLSSLAKPPQLYFNNGEPHGWFYCLSTFRQAMFPPSNFSPKEQLSAESLATSNKDDNHHNASQQLPQKKLLVFDQTGDQTTMIYSSGNGAPLLPCLSLWKEKQAEPSILQPRQDGRDMMMDNADTLMMDDSVDISKFEDDLGSEMHEDTEELNALMYSDGDTDSDDDDEDEVTSTGHSPITLMTIHGIREEVTSSDGERIKRQKLSDGENGISLGNDHIILSHGTSGVDVDTEYLRDSGKTPSLSGKKRARKDTIGETVRKLQKMIPCGNAATPIEVIDEAINFLTSLKLKAKSVGFDSSTL